MAVDRPVPSISHELGDLILAIAGRGSVATVKPASAVSERFAASFTLAILAGLGYGFYSAAHICGRRGPSTIRAVGMVEAPEVNITSRIAGRITELETARRRPGDARAGHLPIEDIDIRNQLRKAEADLLRRRPT